MRIEKICLFEGWIREGLSNGRGRAIFDDGNIYTGEFKDNKRNGFGKFIDAGDG